MIDPTAIPINDDGTTNRDPRFIIQRGTAYHGLTPFECPIISMITDDLWMGGCRDGLVVPEEIKHVVSLYPWEQYETQDSVQSMTQIYMFDAEDEDMRLVEGVADWVNVLRKDGVTLVHCQAGLNRSGVVVATALVRSGMEPVSAIALLRERRDPAVLCNQAFSSWVMGLS